MAETCYNFRAKRGEVHTFTEGYYDYSSQPVVLDCLDCDADPLLNERLEPNRVLMTVDSRIKAHRLPNINIEWTDLDED